MAEPVAKLIALLGAASEGAAELDARIQAIECGEEFVKLDDGPRGAVNMRDHLSVCWIAQSGKRYSCWYTKAYTRSLDAALTLVPDGLSVMLDISPGCSLCTVHDNTWHVGRAAAETATPALAVCIAALKARNHTAASLPETPEAT